MQLDLCIFIYDIYKLFVLCFGNCSVSVVSFSESMGYGRSGSGRSGLDWSGSCRSGPGHSGIKPSRSGPEICEVFYLNR